jgi:hypothetical protein
VKSEPTDVVWITTDERIGRVDYLISFGDKKMLSLPSSTSAVALETLKSALSLVNMLTLAYDCMEIVDSAAKYTP